MSDNAEEGIFKAQAKSGAGAGQHRRSITYLDDRILVYLIALGVVGLFVVWLVAKSALVLYGSLAVVLGMIALWGVLKIKRIERERAARQAVADAWKSDAGSD